MQAQEDSVYMQRCLQLAKMGLGLTYPNPMVGCVIVKNKKIISEAWHKKAGEFHAERLAIEQVTDKNQLQGATLYVNLEPCNHHGKTPPCTEIIQASGIQKVVIGCMDTNPIVSGKGIKFLESHGIECQTIQEEESKYLNRRFFTFHTHQRPYIILKWAQTQDGFMDGERDEGENPASIPISNLYSHQLMHKWRGEEQAILVGTQTVLHDNPRLTPRLWEGQEPTKIILDRELVIPSSFAIFQQEKVLIINEKIQKKEGGVEWVQLDFSSNLLQQLLAFLYDREIQSIMVEGGAKTLSSFLAMDMYDEIRVFQSQDIFGKGLPAPKINLNYDKCTKVGSDLLYQYYR